MAPPLHKSAPPGEIWQRLNRHELAKGWLQPTCPGTWLVRSSRGSGTGSRRGRDPGRGERQARGQAGERQDGDQVPVVEVGDRDREHQQHDRGRPRAACSRPGATRTDAAGALRRSREPQHPAEAGEQDQAEQRPVGVGETPVGTRPSRPRPARATRCWGWRARSRTASGVGGPALAPSDCVLRDGLRLSAGSSRRTPCRRQG